MEAPKNEHEVQFCTALRWKDGVLQGYFVKLWFMGYGFSPDISLRSGEWIDVPRPVVESQ